MKWVHVLNMGPGVLYTLVYTLRMYFSEILPIGQEYLAMFYPDCVCHSQVTPAAKAEKSLSDPGIRKQHRHK